MEAEELTNAAEAVTKSAVVLAMTWASGAVVAAKASGDQEKAWRHFDPCGLLQKLVEVGNDIA
jgi:S-formylglutathione hydrolase FrmB